MKRIQIKKGGAFTAALVLVISMFGGALYAGELGESTQSLTLPGETPALHFEFDDDNPATPPLTVSVNSVKDVTLEYSWSPTNPADLVTVFGRAKKCHPHARINQLIKIGLNAGAKLTGGISYQELDSEGNEVDTHYANAAFEGEAPEKAGNYEMSLCVR